MPLKCRPRVLKHLFKKRGWPTRRAEFVPASLEKKKDEKYEFRDFCYCYFKRFGCALSRIFKNIEKDLDIANMKIHPEVYLSILSFVTIVSSVVPVGLFIIFLSLGVLAWINPILWLILGSLPLFVMLIGLLIPKIVASNRVSGLQIEVPYASMYLSVMVSGGLSPYACLMRLRQTSLLPKLREEIKRIQDRILSSGSDPISVIEKSAKDVGLKEYKDLFLGYASATKTGGDIVHYLYVQTESMFRSLATKIKAVGELMSTLMETYMIVGILGTLGLYMMFIISMSAPTGVTLSQESFFLFAFVILPTISFVFLYLADLLCIKYPSSNQASYIALAASAPLGVFLATQMALSFFYPMLLVHPSLQSFPAHLQSILGFEPGSEPALGLAISLAVIAVPVLIVDTRYSMEERGILQGITSFLREMTENRKSGLSPEKCFRVLSKNDYGRFSRYLKTISSQIGWGFPMRKIIEDFKKKVKNWLAQINIYLLIDTIMVGGGNEKSLEALAEFSETSNALEKERKAMLTPLLIVPFIGALLLIVTTMMFIQFFSSMSSLARPLIPLLTLSRILITPLILHCFLLGLVTGKTVSGRVSSGFRTGMYLLVLSVIAIWISSRLTMFTQFGGG
ncbi:MAG: type II secretion system F family protein [Nitrososphaerota archaeon]